MPIRPYFVSQRHIVISKRPGFLEIETGSGRTIIIFPFIYVFLFQADWLKFPGILVCLVIWTYSKRWVFDRMKNSITGQARILGLKYDDFAGQLTSLWELCVEGKPGPQAVGSIFTLRARFTDNSTCKIAVRNDIRPILGIIREIRVYLQDVTVTIPHQYV